MDQIYKPTNKPFRAAICILMLSVIANQAVAYHPNGITLFGNLTLRDDEESSYNQNPFTESFDVFFASGGDRGFSTLFEFVAERTYQHRHHHTERLVIGYRFNDGLQISMGQFHTPTGFWNSTMHHGSILHDTVTRPFFLSFAHDPAKSSVAPIHILGTVINGELEKEKLSFRYSIFASNPQELSSELHDISDHNHHNKPSMDTASKYEFNDHPSYGFRAVFGLKTSGLTLGFSAMRNPIIESGNLSNNSFVKESDLLIDQTIINLELQYLNFPFDFSSEYFHFENEDEVITNQAHSADAFYVQAGFYLSPSTKIVYRYADLDVENNDLLAKLLDLTDENHHVFTLRHDLNEFNTLKFEVDFGSNEDTRSPANDTFRIEWSFLFH